MVQKLVRKLFVFFSISLIILQSLGGALPVLAQEITPTDEQTVTPTDSPTPTVTTDPTPTAALEETPTPFVSPEPTAEAETPTPTDSPTSEPTTIIDVTTPTPTDSSTSDPIQSHPEDNTSTPTTTASPVPTPVAEVSTSPEGVLSALVISKKSADSIKKINLDTTVEANASLITDKLDYAPTDAVLLTGSNLLPETDYSLLISSTDPPAVNFSTNITSDGQGSFIFAYQLDGNYRPNYSAELKDSAGTVVATTTFTDSNPSANLDQCANDPAPSPSTDGCSASASDWVNGNLGSSKSSYFEGDSIPYRLTFGSLSLSSHTVTIEWDTTKSDKHAIDYLTTFNRTVATANPCLGVSGCTASTTFAIPADPQVTGAGVTPVAGNFTLYGGTITGVSAYSYSNGSGFVGDKSARISITFTASQANPVLAWGGHIATRFDWGADMAATAIPGSPYHTRLIDLDGSGGNQDRSLSADAVIFPGSITVVKQATPEGSTSFPFTASPAPLSNFSLVDDGTSANTKIFSNITNFQTYNVSETAPGGWTLDGIVCGVTSPNGGSQTVTNPSVSINLKEGENVTCTYANTLQQATLIVKKVVINDNGGTKTASDFTFKVNGGNAVAFEADGQNDLTINTGTYSIVEPSVTGYATTYNNCTNLQIPAGGTATCTVTNNDIQPKLTVTKVVVNDNGGTKVVSNFPLFVNATSVTSGVQNEFNAGSYVVSETQQTGYTQTSITGNCDANGNVTLAAGDVKSCTITNNDNAPALHLRKTVTNDNGGSALNTAWTLTATGTGGSPTNLSGTTPVDSTATFKADTYVLGESGPSGYTAGVWDCGNATKPDATHVTVPLGGDVTCTINNNDNPAHIIVIKHVINNNGDTATSSSFSTTITGVATANPTASGVESPGVDNVLTTVGSYSVDEGSHVGYDKTLSADCLGSIALGQTKTCTITNDDQTATLIVKKVVINDNGGTLQANSFTFKVNGGSAISFEADGQNDLTVNAGTYSVVEPSVNGYATTYSNCSNLVIPNGSSATCTVTNNDRSGNLIVHKLTDPANDQTVFSVTLDSNPVSGDATQDLSTISDVNYEVNAGTYSVSEDSKTGWSETENTCSNVTVANGQTKECTITNTKLPTLTVNKICNPTGDTGLFNLQIDGVNKTTASICGGTTFPVIVSVGSHTVGETGSSETNLANYASIIGGDCSADGTVSLAAGENKVCTITNTKYAKVIVTKYLDDNANGTKDEGENGLPQWSINLGNATQQTGEDGTTTFSNLLPDTYTLGENIQEGWNLSNISCANQEQGGLDTSNEHSVNIGAGETVYCFIGNYQKAHITVTKVLYQPDEQTVASNDDTSFDFAVTGQNGFALSNGDSKSFNVKPGTYDVSEFTPNQNYSFLNCQAVYGNQSIGSPIAGGEEVLLGSNDNVTVTCYNAQKGGTITGDKFNDINNNGQECSNESETCQPKLPGWHIQLFENNGGTKGNQVGSDSVTDANGNFTFANVTPGTYFICEVQQPGWEQTYPNFDSEYSNCYSVTVTSNESFNGNDFGNHSLTPSLTIAKSNDAIGNKGPGDNVTYTITVTVNDADANNVTVTDLLPKGFIYNNGSWSVNLNGNPLAVPEPNYHSPGVWSLGNAHIGDVFILKYTANIDGGEQPGIYNDVAWAQGTSLIAEDVLALALPQGFVDTNFVGTQVSIAAGNPNGPTFNTATRIQEVLGASTSELPSTGEDTLWVIIATLMLALGTGTLMTGFKLKKKYE